MPQTIIFSSLILILILFLVQSIRLRNRNRQIRETLEQLKELDKHATLGRLLIGVAHDLNTPLGALECALHTRNRALEKLRTILESGGASGADEAAVQKVFSALDNTGNVLVESMERTREMLTHLRQAGRGEPEGPVVLAVDEVMDRVLRILDHRLKSGITVIKEIEPDLLVRVQPGELGRVFANLLVNAQEAMDDEGEIRIVGRRDSGRVTINISDNGPGLPPGHKDNLFCSGWSTKQSKQGSGLGLYISREIMRGFGGDLSAANGLNGGAEMSLWLPLASGEDQ
jgi:C4-dicarboxylate-specific signal transduction histidine kinase